MLPKNLKFTSSAEFSRTMRRGAKSGSGTVVAHVHVPKAEPSTAPDVWGGPRFGLVVSKAVGNAVVRHNTSRRLRHIARALAPELPRGARVVLRALPRAGSADTTRLARDVRYAVTKALRKADTDGQKRGIDRQRS